jgi:diguanylate cyclase (GGDEF)-like protein/PAS domain S-box-containing protein
VTDAPHALGRGLRIGLPLLAGALVLGLGSAYFLQKDRYQRAAQQADEQRATDAAANEFTGQLKGARSAATLLSILLAGTRAGELDDRVKAARVALEAADDLAVSAADGRELWRARRPSQDTMIAPAGAGTLTAAGEPELRVKPGRLVFVQMLHDRGNFAGEATAEIDLERVGAKLAGLLSDNARFALYHADGPSSPALLLGSRLPPETPATPVGHPADKLWLAVKPDASVVGNPFLPVELALCALAAALCTAFGIAVLSHPRRRSVGDEVATDANSAPIEAVLDLSPNPACHQNSNGRYLAVNRAFERFTGHDRETLRQWGEVAAQPGDLFEVLAQSRLPAEAEAMGADGRRHALAFSTIKLSSLGALEDGGRLTMIIDRTDIAEAARRVSQLTRSFAVFSGISEAVVCQQYPDQLLERSCELLVERGEFPLAFAWKRGANGLEVASVRGEEPALATRLLEHLVRCPADCDAFGSKIVVCTGERCRNQPVFAAVAPLGIRSLALIPLRGGRECGIGLASTEIHAFSADETDLLRALTATLDHALTTMESDSARRQAEERLRLSARVFENSSEGIIITDAQNRIVMVNRTFSQVTGYSAAEVIGRNPRVLSSGEQSPEFYREMWAAIERRGEWHGEVQNRRKNGQYFSEWLTISVVRNDQGDVTNYVAVFSDITSHKQIAERLNFLANYDPLTTLPNRVLFTDRLERAMAAARLSRRLVATLALDLDRFSLVNETFGHAAGDQMLKEIARRLRAAVRDGDSVSRVGGDEFSIVLADLESADEATVIAGKIMQSLATPLVHDGQEIFASASIGISVFPDDGEDTDSLVRNANSAMYRAMEEGRNTFRFYHQEMNARSSERMSLQSELRRALERGELVMHYQPLIDARDGRILGAEALLRWFRPGIGFLTPAAFIPLLEESGQIVPVGEWVLNSALEDCKRWHAQGHRDLFVAVNFSPLQLFDARVARHVADSLARLDVNPRQLEIELTESAIMREPATGIRVLNEFREIGARLSIDDFGTGYSSLAYLKKLPIDTLKIDRSFVVDTPDEKEANSIVQAIVAMGHNLDLRIIAEGVQAKPQVEFLRQTRCDLLQGYYFSGALPQKEFVDLIESSANPRTAPHWLSEPWPEPAAPKLTAVTRRSSL